MSPRRTFTIGVTALLTAAASVLAGGSPAGAVQLAQDRVVAANPANNTPNVLDGKVEAIARVGNTIVIAGAFSQVAPSGGATVTRNNIVAFDATTGTLSTTFVPTTDGEITSIVVSADQQAIYIGGFFNTVNGAASKSLAKLNVSNGARTAGFMPPALSGRIKDLRLSGGRLWIAGTFAAVGSAAQAALATLDPTTGARTPYMGLAFAGPRNGGALQVMKIDITPAGDKLVAIGNFTTINGLDRGFMGVLDLSGGTAAAVADWQTNFYGPTCAGVFDTYMRDLDVSPDGSYVVVSTTGAYFGSSSPCDQTSRWNLSATGSNLSPAWTDYTGGDTTYAVAVTGSAVYVGGHFRWQNNPFAGDSAGAGAVAREGIAALDPANGLPLNFNPGRDRGVGVFDMLATPTGLWVASDTDVIGGETHRKIAFLPLAGGEVIPAANTGVLPGHVFLAGGVAANGPVLYRVNAGGPTLLATDSGPDWSGDAAADSTLRNSGSNAAAWGSGATPTASVPSTTPAAIFDTERWDPNGDPELHWSFPVPAGTPLQVRLYLANRCGCTSAAGSRVFTVAVDGTAVLSTYDIVADAGDQVGTMKAFPVTSDGTVNIDFTHVTENPLVNGIEIVRTDVTGPAPSADDLQDRYLTATSATAVGPVPGGGVAWSAARGAVMINGSVYYGASDGSFTSRTFDGTTFGPAVAIDTADQLVPMTDWHNEVRNITGMFFTGGRLYYTLAGDGNLYDRWFTPSSKVVGAQRFTASGSVAGLDLTTADGMMLVGGALYVGSTDGSLRRVDWNGTAPVAGTATTVSGPGVDGVSWRNRAMWLYTGTNLPAPGSDQAPTAAATVTCSGLTCTASGSGSSDPDGTIASYAWTFGDGGTGTGVSASHTYAAPGTYTVGLTVTDNGGATGTTTTTATVSVPATAVSFVGAAAVNVNATSATVTVPAAVTAGDTLLMFVTNNSSTSTVATPAGWTVVGTKDLGSGNGTSTVFSRAAVAGTAGSTVTVTQSAIAKVGVTLAAYHGTAAAGVASATGAVETVSSTSHTTPGGTVADDGSLVVSYWADKSAATTTWTPPAGQAQRSQTAGTSSGRITTLLTDDGAGHAPGASAPLTAVADAASARAAMWTVVVKPA